MDARRSPRSGNASRAASCTQGSGGTAKGSRGTPHGVQRGGGRIGCAGMHGGAGWMDLPLRTPPRTAHDGDPRATPRKPTSLGTQPPKVGTKGGRYRRGLGAWGGRYLGELGTRGVAACPRSAWAAFPVHRGSAAVHMRVGPSRTPPPHGILHVLHVPSTLPPGLVLVVGVVGAGP